MNENNKVFELSDEELAKVVGGQTDRNTEVKQPDPLPPLDVPPEYHLTAPDHCDHVYMSDWKCIFAPNQRTAVECPWCSHNT